MATDSTQPATQPQTIEDRYPAGQITPVRVARLQVGQTILVARVDPRRPPEPVPHKGRWVAPEPYAVVITAKTRKPDAASPPEATWLLESNGKPIGDGLSGLRLLAVVPTELAHGGGSGV